MLSDYQLFRAQICDSKKPIYKIYLKGTSVADISHDTDELLLELYIPESKTRLSVMLEEFELALENAKEVLFEENDPENRF